MLLSSFDSRARDLLRLLSSSGGVGSMEGAAEVALASQLRATRRALLPNESLATRLVREFGCSDDPPALESVGPSGGRSGAVTLTPDLERPGFSRIDLSAIGHVVMDVKDRESAASMLMEEKTGSTHCARLQAGAGVELRFDRDVGFTNVGAPSPPPLAKVLPAPPTSQTVTPPTSAPFVPWTSAPPSAKLTPTPTTSAAVPAAPSAQAPAAKSWMQPSPTVVSVAVPSTLSSPVCAPPPLQRQGSASSASSAASCASFTSSGGGSSRNADILQTLKQRLGLHAGTVLTANMRASITADIGTFISTLRQLQNVSERHCAVGVQLGVDHVVVRTALCSSVLFLDNCKKWIMQYVRKGFSAAASLEELLDFCVTRMPNINALIDRPPAVRTLDSFFFPVGEEATRASFNDLYAYVDQMATRPPLGVSEAAQRFAQAAIAQWHDFDAVAWWHRCLDLLVPVDDELEEEVPRAPSGLAHAHIDDGVFHQRRHVRATNLPKVVEDDTAGTVASETSATTTTSATTGEKRRRVVIDEEQNEVVQFFKNDPPTPRSILQRRAPDGTLISPRPASDIPHPPSQQQQVIMSAAVPLGVTSGGLSSFLRTTSAPASCSTKAPPPLAQLDAGVVKSLMNGFIPFLSSLTPTHGLRTTSDVSTMIFERIMPVLLQSRAPWVEHWSGLGYQLTCILRSCEMMNMPQQARQVALGIFFSPLEGRAWSDVDVREREWSLDRILARILPPPPREAESPPSKRSKAEHHALTAANGNGHNNYAQSRGSNMHAHPHAYGHGRNSGGSRSPPPSGRSLSPQPQFDPADTWSAPIHLPRQKDWGVCEAYNHGRCSFVGCPKRHICWWRDCATRHTHPHTGAPCTGKTEPITLRQSAYESVRQ